MRGTGIAIVIGLAACSGRASSPSVAGPVPDPGVSTPPDAGPPAYVLPALVPGPAFDLVCEDFPAALEEPRKKKSKQYEFAATALPSSADLPRFTERSRAGFARSPHGFEAVISWRSSEIEACWKWASARTKDATAVELEVSVDADPWGRIDGLDVTGPDGTDELRTCVEEMLSGQTLGRVVSRRTHAVATIAFQVEDGLKPWKKKPRRPARPDPDPASLHGHHCAAILRDAPTDELVIQRAWTITDFDPSRQPPRPREETPVASKDPVVPAVGGGGCPAPSAPELDKATIRAMIRSNAGAYGACHADARARDAALAGEVRMKFVIDASGGVTVGTIEGAGDAALHDCLRVAMEEVWFQVVNVEVQADWTWSFDEAYREPAPDDPVALLRDGDDAAAQAIWAEDLGGQLERDSLLGVCLVRGHILQGMMARAPWFDDSRVYAALDDLVTALVATPPDQGRECLDGSGKRTLGKLLPGGDRVSYGAAELLAFYERLLPIADLLSDKEDGLPVVGDSLRWSRIRLMSHYDRGAAEAAAAELVAAYPENDTRRAWLDDLRQNGVLFARCSFGA